MRNDRQGFTLVELIVVVAIIAILAGLVLTAIGATRTAARRSQCGNGVHQLVAVLAVYAEENQGGVPLVYGSCRQANYLVVDNLNTTAAWGVVWNSGIIDDPKAMYCPAITESSAYNRFNLSTNVWPHQSGQYTRAGYALRPDTAPGAGLTIPRKVPQLGAFAAKAVLADLCSQSGHLDFCHVGGVNAGFGDGHVQWCPRAAMAPSWLAIPSNASWNNAYDAAETALWNSFDAQ